MTLPLLAKDNQPLEGRKFRFIVKSAQEAVTTIREHLGENAKVLEIKQIEGKGLGRFLASPKLEVIAMVPPKEAPLVSENVSRSNDNSSLKPTMPSAEDFLYPDFQEKQVYTKPNSMLNKRYSMHTSLKDLLYKSGFSEILINSFCQSNDWVYLETLSLSEGLQSILKKLVEQYKILEKKPVTNRIAFLGTPGSGKTMALCKYMATEVFVRSQKGYVTKLDNLMASSNEALRLFSEVLGNEWLVDISRVNNLSTKNKIYSDLASPSLKEKEEWIKIKYILDQYFIDTRIWVIQATQDHEIIKANFDLAMAIGATHVVFTHLDEIFSTTKLWHYILHGGLSPLFFSHGQSISGDISEDVLSFLIENTFPQALRF